MADHTAASRLSARVLAGPIALLAATLLTLTACGSSADPAPRPTSTPRPLSYVALGDSYTAGPQIAPTDARSGACARSTLSYPRLVAEALHASLRDVSCSGATTDDVLDRQIGSVTSSTRLVTVGIGGNDSGLFTALSLACTRAGTACRDYLADEVPGILASTRTHVVRVLREVHDRAPRAEVVLVGYLRVSPDGAGCQGLGGAALDTRGVSDGERAIDRMLASAARAGRATYVSLNAASKGHDACAGAAAWTNGLSPALGDGAPLHPRKAGMRAVARAVRAAL